MVLNDMTIGLMQVSQVLVPVVSGRHCAAALRMADLLAVNGVEVTALIMTSSANPHNQVIPSRFKLRYGGAQTVDDATAVTAPPPAVPHSRSSSVDRQSTQGSQSSLISANSSSVLLPPASAGLVTTEPAPATSVGPSFVDATSIHIEVASESPESVSRTIEVKNVGNQSGWDAIIYELERGTDSKLGYQLLLLSDQTMVLPTSSDVAHDDGSASWASLARATTLTHVICVHAAHDDSDPHVHAHGGLASSPSIDDISATTSPAVQAKACRSYAMTALCPPPPSIVRASSAKPVILHV
jgi:hypothetical protein